MISSFRKPLVGERTTASSNVKGQSIPGTTSALNFTASVQPLTGRERETLPEGLREKGAFRLYTDFALRADNQKTKAPADSVILDDKKYIVIIAKPWENNVIPHRKVIVSEAND